MAKQIGITLDDDLYEELVHRAGGPRKLSNFLNPLLRGKEGTQAAEAVPDIPPELAYAIASEEVLSRDWLSPEDEEAWRNL